MIAKLLLCLASLAAIASAVELSDGAKEIIGTCSKDHNIEIDQIRNAVQNRKLPETENGKCFVQCVMEKGGIIKDDKIDADRAKELSGKKLADKPDVQAKVNEAIDNCAKEVMKPEGTCEFGLEILKCAIKQREAMGLPPPELEGL